MKKKIQLKELTVKSFVTGIEGVEKQTIQGGDRLTFKGCNSEAFFCGSEYPDTLYWNGPCRMNSKWCME